MSDMSAGSVFELIMIVVLTALFFFALTLFIVQFVL